MQDSLLVAATIILESFPISSSGHITLLTQLLQKYPLSQAVEYFLHGPFALMLIVFFYPRWRLFIVALRRQPRIIYKLMSLGIITDSLTVLLYAFFLFVPVAIPLWIGFLITGCALLSLYWCPSYRKGASWNVTTALALGAIQGIALLPGISRFGSTYVGARWMGMKSQKAFELSFLIEFPLIVAGALKGLYKLQRDGLLSEVLKPMTCMTMLFATLAAYLGLYWMYYICMKHKEWWIGLYLIVVSILAYSL